VINKGLRYQAFLPLVAVAVGLWLLQVMAVPELANGFLYDWSVRHAVTTRQQATSPVVLVRAELSSQSYGDDYWLTLLETVLKEDPYGVAFMVPPERASPRFYETATTTDKVIFGRTRVFRDNDLGFEGLSLLPATSKGVELSYGIAEMPPGNFGAYRRQLENYPFFDTTLPSFAARAAQLALGHVYTPPEEPRSFLINFNSGPGQIPLISAERILANALPGTLLNKKVVIVGYVDDIHIPGLRTPLNTGYDRMSLLEYHGYAVNTILNDNRIDTVPAYGTVTLVLLISIAGIALYRNRTLRQGSWITVAMILLYLYAAWFMVSFLFIWIPLAEMIASQLIVFMVILRQKAIYKEQTLQKLVSTTTQRVSQATLVPFADKNEHYWNEIVDLIDQTLDISRMIFLEPVAGTHALQEVRARDTSLSEIDERRRDLRRAPFSTALEVNAPLRLTSRFFKNPEPNEDEYLVALRNGPEIAGFWAFAIDKKCSVTIPMFTSSIQAFADQISDLLIHRAEWNRQEQHASGWVTSLLNLDTRNQPYNEVYQSIAALGSRLKSLEDMINSLGTATAYYDLFGRPVVVNSSMSIAMEQADISVSQLSALELVCAITNLSQAEARKSLRYVVLQRGQISVITTLETQTRATLMLNIRPLLQDRDNLLGESEPAPFQLRGTLFELVDISDLQRIYQLKENLISKINQDLQENLKTMNRATGILSNDSVAPEHRERLAKVTSSKVAEAVSILEQSQRYLQQSLHTGSIEYFPLDPVPFIEQAVDATRTAMGEKNLELVYHPCDLSTLVFAEPNTLTNLVRTLLSLLIHSAARRTRIELNLEQDAVHVARSRNITVRLKNRCTGMTESRVHGIFSGQEKEFLAWAADLRNDSEVLERWGGALEIHGEETTGLTVKLQLKGFL
jgi:hypothetical protein